MNPRRLLACLAAAFAPVAWAQSSITLYGVVDAGYLYTRPGNGASLSELADGIQTPSRLGFRGTEALGDGWSAKYTLEMGFSVDTGTLQQGGRIFGRQAWAALQGPIGELRLGRQYGVGYDLFIAGVSPFGTTFRDAGLSGVFSSASARLILDNVAQYRTPTWKGVTGIVGYSFNADGQEVAGATNNVGVWTGGVQYSAGPAYLAVTYENFNCPGNTTVVRGNTCNGRTQDAQSQFQIGGSWNFGPLTAYAAWALEKNQFTLFAITPSEDSQSFEVGAGVPLWGGNFLASYQMRNDKAFGADLNVWAAGYTYPLSRRTNLYTFVSDTTADSTPTAQRVVNGVVVTAGYTAPQIANYLARDRLQFGFGLRHLF